MGGLPTAKPRNAQRALVISHPWLLEVHFRGAWQKLQEMEARLGTKRTERTTGGPRGGGTRLTAKGQDYVHQMRWWTAGLQELIEPQFAEAFEASGFFYRSLC
jgi:molybdate transport repressor ModE-like protein